MYSKNKGADQLCSYRTAGLSLCFHVCKIFDWAYIAYVYLAVKIHSIDTH